MYSVLSLSTLFDVSLFACKQVYNIRAVAVYGGGGKWEMSKALKDECPEIVIATPGRFIEMVSNGV